MCRLNCSRTDCTSKTLLVDWIQFFYQSSTTAAIAHQRGLEVIPQTIATTLLSLIQQSMQCNSFLILQPRLPSILHSSPMAAKILTLASASYSSVDGSLNIVLQPSNGIRGIADVLAGNAAAALVAFNPDSKLFDFTTPTANTPPTLMSSSSSSSSASGTMILSQHPSIGVFPFAISALVPIHSIVFTPGVPVPTPPLQLDLVTLAAIIMGDVKTWNDPMIAALNPMTAAYLPSAPINFLLTTGPSDLTSQWRSTLSQLVPNFSQRVGIGADQTNVTAENIITVPVDSRLDQTVANLPNSCSIVQLLDVIISSPITILLYPLSPSTSSSTPPPSASAVNASLATLSACAQFLTSTEQLQLITPADTALNPASNVRARDFTYQYDPNDWSQKFFIDLRSASMSCWPFSTIIYAVVPLSYTRTLSTQSPSTTPFDPSQPVSILPSGLITEPSRLGKPTGDCTQGKSTIQFFYWLYSGGVLNRPQLSLQQLPLSDSTRQFVRQALEHSDCDGQPLLTIYPVNFIFNHSIVQLSYSLCGIGIGYVLVLCIFLVRIVKSAIVRASSVPFLSYAVLGAGMGSRGITIINHITTFSTTV